MAISKGSKTVIQEVVDAVVGKINAHIATVNNDGVGNIWYGQSTGVSWGGKKEDIVDFNIQKSAEFLKTKNIAPTNADSTFQFITECMWNACRVYVQIYSYYQAAGYANIQGYRPPISTISCYGFHESPCFGKLTLEQYQHDRRPLDMYAGQKMIAKSVTDLIDNLMAFNTKMENDQTVNHGLRNTCYSSCHSSCHGSSRGRR